MQFPTFNDITVYNSVLIPSTGKIESKNVIYIPDPVSEAKNEFQNYNDFDPPFGIRLR